MKKNIVFLSSSKKRMLLKEFSTAYKFILLKHSLFAPFEDSYIIRDVGLSCTPLLSASVGGYRQIISKLQCGELDLVIFFRGTYYFEKVSSIESEVLLSCDCYNVPVATNVLTAEIILQALDAGIF